MSYLEKIEYRIIPKETKAMKYDAMIVIDMQKALVNAHPYNEVRVIENIKKLQEACRKNGISVIYVRHDGGTGDELEYGTDGWQIYQELKPQADEKIVEKKYNSAFRQTNLDAYLKQIKAKKLIMCGMQTEYCFDVSCKVAFEYGYEVTIPKDTTTTFDNDFSDGKSLANYFEEKIWNNRYAKVLPIETVLAEITN